MSFRSVARPEAACAPAEPTSGGSSIVWFPSILTRHFAPRAISGRSLSSGQRSATVSHIPRELSGRHRTTTLMFPSPWSAIGRQSCTESLLRLQLQDCSRADWRHLENERNEHNDSAARIDEGTSEGRIWRATRKRPTLLATLLSAHVRSPSRQTTFGRCWDTALRHPLSSLLLDDSSTEYLLCLVSEPASSMAIITSTGGSPCAHLQAEISDATIS